MSIHYVYMSTIHPIVDLRPDHLEIVFDAIRRHIPDRKVLAFGSRATWTARDYSDLDLAVMGEKPLPWSTHLALYDEFVESKLPFRVDIVDWARTKDYFRKIIHEYAVTLQSPVMIKNDHSSRKEPSSCPIGWVTHRIGEIGEIVVGGTPFKEDVSCFDGDIPWLTLRDLSRNHDRHIRHRVQSLSQEGLNACSARIVPTGTLLIASRKSIGSVAVAANPVATNEELLSLIPDPGYHSEFLYYWLKANTHELEKYSAGVVFDELSRSALQRMRINLPESISEQQMIAHVLGAIDDKIEVNRRMNATLEAMGQALFKSWFVDFDPVRAKMEGRDKGLAGKADDAIPHYIGPDGIPTGWRNGTIGESFFIKAGRSPLADSCDEYVEGIPFFRDSADFGFRYPKKREYCSAPISIAKSGDTLVSRQAPMGNINMVWDECCIGGGLTALRHKSGSASFTYYSVLSLQQELRRHRHSSLAKKTIDDKFIQALQVIEPSLRVIALWESVIAPLDQRIRNNVSENYALANIRDSLLPDLVSGKIDIGGIPKALADDGESQGHIYNQEYISIAEECAGRPSRDHQDDLYTWTMKRLIDELREQLMEASRLELAIQTNLSGLFWARAGNE